jgi:DNA-binding NarL/FixJ family response regulator
MTEGLAIRVLVADDHLLFAELLATSLAQDELIEVVGVAANGEEAVRLSDLLRPDVILMDLCMPVVDGVEATRRIVDGALHPPQILVLTGSDDAEAVQGARAAGAAGFLTKNQSASELRQALVGLVSLAAALGSGQAAGARA